MPVTISGTDGITSPTITTTGVIVSGTTVADATAVIRPLVSATAVATTSGTSKDFTSIPSWVKRITVMFNGVSTSGSSAVQIQLGDSGGVETTGYLGCSTELSSVVNGTDNFNSGFGNRGGNLGNVRQGAISISLLDGSSNTWTAFGILALSNNAFLSVTGGTKVLSATLDRVRITTVNGTDTFDAGSINILYE